MRISVNFASSQQAAEDSREATAMLLAHAFGDIGLPRLAGVG